MKKAKLLKKLLSGSKNISFSDAATCAKIFGFRLDRINGSHHIFVHSDIPELVNLQNNKGKAFFYQVTDVTQNCFLARFQPASRASRRLATSIYGVVGNSSKV